MSRPALLYPAILKFFDLLTCDTTPNKTNAAQIASIALIKDLPRFHSRNKQP